MCPAFTFTRKPLVTASPTFIFTNKLSPLIDIHAINRHPIPVQPPTPDVD